MLSGPGAFSMSPNNSFTTLLLIKSSYLAMENDIQHLLQEIVGRPIH